MNFKRQLKEGLITKNPVLVQLLGMCSTMAITTSISNGIGMGISVLIILTLSNIFISLLRKIIPNEVRIACYIVVIAGFVTIVDNAETSGIGSKVMDNVPTAKGVGVLDQFVGMSGAGSLSVGSNVDAISGATVSSKGVTKGVNTALAAAEAIG